MTEQCQLEALKGILHRIRISRITPYFMICVLILIFDQIAIFF